MFIQCLSVEIPCFTLLGPYNYFVGKGGQICLPHFINEEIDGDIHRPLKQIHVP